MAFVYVGTHLYGKVDQVEGLFYVATKFLHLNFLPLVPLGSHLVFAGTEKDGGFRGVPLGWSFKSIAFTYLRLALLALLALGITLTVFFAIESAKPGGNWRDVEVWSTVLVVCALSFWGSYRLTRASPWRAL